MSIQTPFQVKMPFGMISAGCAGDLGRLPHALRSRLDVIWRDQETSHAIHDYLGEPAALERDDGRPARLGISGSHAKRLVPP